MFWHIVEYYETRAYDAWLKYHDRTNITLEYITERYRRICVHVKTI